MDTNTYEALAPYADDMEDDDEYDTRQHRGAHSAAPETAAAPITTSPPAALRRQASPPAGRPAAAHAPRAAAPGAAMRDTYGLLPNASGIVAAQQQAPCRYPLQDATQCWATLTYAFCSLFRLSYKRLRDAVAQRHLDGAIIEFADNMLHIYTTKLEREIDHYIKNAKTPQQLEAARRFGDRSRNRLKVILSTPLATVTFTFRGPRAAFQQLWSFGALNE